MSTLTLIIALLVLLILSFPFVVRQLAKKSGWSALSEKYATKEPRRTIIGMRAPVRTAFIGGFAYQLVFRVVVARKGLFLGTAWPFSYTHPNVMIPWKDVKSAGNIKTVLGKGKRFTLGNPVITTVDFRNADFEKLKPHLRGKGIIMSNEKAPASAKKQNESLGKKAKSRSRRDKGGPAFISE